MSASIFFYMCMFVMFIVIILTTYEISPPKFGLYWSVIPKYVDENNIIPAYMSCFPRSQGCWQSDTRSMYERTILNVYMTPSNSSRELSMNVRSPVAYDPPSPAIRTISKRCLSLRTSTNTTQSIESLLRNTPKDEIVGFTIVSSRISTIRLDHIDIHSIMLRQMNIHHFIYITLDSLSTSHACEFNVSYVARNSNVKPIIIAHALRVLGYSSWYIDFMVYIKRPILPLLHHHLTHRSIVFGRRFVSVQNRIRRDIDTTTLFAVRRNVDMSVLREFVEAKNAQELSTIVKRHNKHISIISEVYGSGGDRINVMLSSKALVAARITSTPRAKELMFWPNAHGYYDSEHEKYIACDQLMYEPQRFYKSVTLLAAHVALLVWLAHATNRTLVLPHGFALEKFVWATVITDVGSIDDLHVRWREHTFLNNHNVPVRRMSPIVTLVTHDEEGVSVGKWTDAYSPPTHTTDFERYTVPNGRRNHPSHNAERQLREMLGVITNVPAVSKAKLVLLRTLQPAGFKHHWQRALMIGSRFLSPKKSESVLLRSLHHTYTRLRFCHSSFDKGEQPMTDETVCVVKRP